MIAISSAMFSRAIDGINPKCITEQLSIFTFQSLDNLNLGALKVAKWCTVNDLSSDRCSIEGAQKRGK